MSVPNDQVENVIATEEIKDTENISEKVETYNVITEITIADRSEQTTVKDEVVTNITEEKFMLKRKHRSGF